MENRSASASHAAAYSKRIVSEPRVRLRRATPTCRVRPSRSIWTSMSGIVRVPRRALDAHALRQLGARQRLADAVSADVCDLTETVEETERLEDGAIDADADIR